MTEALSPAEKDALYTVVNRDGWYAAQRLAASVPTYREAVKLLIEREGRPVELDSAGEVSYYGWVDYNAEQHVRKDEECGGWGITHSEVVIVEDAYDQFQDTMSGNRIDHGINVYPASCFCGRYSRTTLRWEGSFQEALRKLLDL